MELGRRSFLAGAAAAGVVPTMLELRMPAIPGPPQKRIVFDEFHRAVRDFELRGYFPLRYYPRVWPPELPGADGSGKHDLLSLIEKPVTLPSFPSIGEPLATPYVSVNGLFRRMSASVSRLISAGWLGEDIERELDERRGDLSGLALAHPPSLPMRPRASAFLPTLDSGPAADEA